MKYKLILLWSMENLIHRAGL